VRYQQTFTAEGTPIGVGRVLWAELRTKAKGTIALHRFRPQGGAERLWLANGEAATPPSMRLPLDTMTVSSGYGLRADPLDKPAGTALRCPIRQSRSRQRTSRLPPPRLNSRWWRRRNR
jgi:hypothetical protein